MKSRNNLSKCTTSLTLPPWYWKKGLHDAQICQMQHYDNSYHENTRFNNCLELIIDSRHALFDTSVKRICFYNFKILSPDAEIVDAWWISDELIVQNGKYIVQIAFRKGKEMIKYSIRFENCVVFRE